MLPHYFCMLLENTAQIKYFFLKKGKLLLLFIYKGTIIFDLSKGFWRVFDFMQTSSPHLYIYFYIQRSTKFYNAAFSCFKMCIFTTIYYKCIFITISTIIN